MNRTGEAHGMFACPDCGGGDFDAVSGYDVNFLCKRCGACWHVELGYISRVDPRTCGGCPHLGDCLARLTVARAGR